MKIRQGFVSNSSSSSFCIYGAELQDEDIKKFLPEKLQNSSDDKYEWVEEAYELGVEWWSVASKIEDALGEGFSCFHDYEEADFYVGRELKSLKDDETGADFKASVDERLTEVFGDGYCCEFIEETVQC